MRLEISGIVLNSLYTSVMYMFVCSWNFVATVYGIIGRIRGGRRKMKVVGLKNPCAAKFFTCHAHFHSCTR